MDQSPTSPSQFIPGLLHLPIPGSERHVEALIQCVHNHGGGHRSWSGTPTEALEALAGPGE